MLFRSRGQNPILDTHRNETKKPYPRGVDTEVLLIAFMFLLVKHIIPRTIISKENGITKFVPVLEFLTGNRYNDDPDLFLDLFVMQLCW